MSGSNTLCESKLACIRPDPAHNVKESLTSAACFKGRCHTDWMEFQLLHSGGLGFVAVSSFQKLCDMQEDIFMGRDMLQELAFFLVSASCGRRSVRTRTETVVMRCC